MRSPYRDVALGLAVSTVGCLLALIMAIAATWQASKWIFDRKVPGERPR